MKKKESPYIDGLDQRILKPLNHYPVFGNSVFLSDFLKNYKMKT